MNTMNITKTIKSYLKLKKKTLRTENKKNVKKKPLIAYD